MEDKMKKYLVEITETLQRQVTVIAQTRDEAEQKDLLQVFNRGMSSSGHLDNNPNRNLVFKKNPSNMGLFFVLRIINHAYGIHRRKAKGSVKRL